jgi:hypothetical protein
MQVVDVHCRYVYCVHSMLSFIQTWIYLPAIWGGICRTAKWNLRRRNAAALGMLAQGAET